MRNQKWAVIVCHTRATKYHSRLLTRASNIAAKARRPKEFEVYRNDRSRRGQCEYYFSPLAARLCSDLLRAYRALPCDAPDLQAEGTWRVLPVF